jgi:hypothetical protein
LGKLEEVGLGMVESVEVVETGEVKTVEESLVRSREKGI